MPGGFVCRLAQGAAEGAGRARGRAAPERPLRKLFAQHRAFNAAHAPAGIELDDLVAARPVFVLKLKGVPPGAAASS